MELIDLRSDTVTIPTKEMLKFMHHSIQNNINHTEKLTNLAAEITQKDEAILCLTGTMANQIAVMAHAGRGQEIILGADTHLNVYEQGGVGMFSQAQVRLMPQNKGQIDLIQLEQVLRKKKQFQTALICIENPINGIVLPQKYMKDLYSLCQKFQIPLHIDGARIFMASSKQNIDVSEITQYCDSMMMCLSKNLLCPIGSLLVGNNNFINNAKQFRNLFSGDIDKVNQISAAGLYSLCYIVPQLKQDLENAKILEKKLREIPEIIIAVPVETCTIFFNFNFTYNYRDLYNFLKTFKIKLMEFLFYGGAGSNIRIVVHHYIKQEQIDIFTKAIHQFIEKQNEEIQCNLTEKLTSFETTKLVEIPTE